MAHTYSNSDIINLFITHGECNKIVARTCRKFNELYPHLPPMNEKKFRRFEANFKNHGKITVQRVQVSPITNYDINIINVLGYFEAYPHASIYSAENDLGISYSSVERILQKNGMHNYKFETAQFLREGDAIQRVEYCEMLLIKMQEDPGFLKKIIWSDESKFTREGIFNRRNSHFWATENPHFIKERGFQDKFGFNVFCLLMDNQFAYSIYDENLNSEKYFEVLNNTLRPFLDNLPLETQVSCWYQLDGAPAHCTQQISYLLYDWFDDRWMRRLGPSLWPPRSPDLTPLDFYLWGTLKERIYKTPVQSKEELIDRVHEAFQNLDGEEIRRATTHHVESTILKCLEANGGHFR